MIINYYFDRNKLIITFLSLITLTLLLGYACHAEAVSPVNSIYIDPAFGGADTGPELADNKNAKDKTLEFARAIKDNVKKIGIDVNLSREKDEEVSAEDRWLHAVRFKNPEETRKTILFISIRISNIKGKDGVRIYYPNKEIMLSNLNKRRHKTSQGKILDDAYSKAIIEYVVQGSNKFKNILVAALKKAPLSISITDMPGDEFILNRAEVPTVILDFAISDFASPSAFVLNHAITDKVIISVANSIEEYLSSNIVAPSGSM